MDRSDSFPVGASIVWRSRPKGAIGFVFGCHVIADDREVAVVVQSKGDAISRRLGRRGGPQGRSLLLGGWDGARADSVWDGPPTVRLHPVGRCYSVIRTWLENKQRFHGWYVNLEQPCVRTTVGFDSRDDVLDVTVTNDLGESALKDEDELDFAVDQGTLTSSEARSIRLTAASAIDDIANRRWPFDERAWEAFRPARYDEHVDLPTGWDSP